eukprot:TRINITY_DN1806_c0_g1_i10.p2 TRINITY_DN1806_c0_g1~~TRINITY_DN1806_c0_g1_i10.p2  ORF type:complete len:132 (+),score=36.11 TRINITY_DN1806_c0_g1_i10:132-527(+)
MSGLTVGRVYRKSLKLIPSYVRSPGVKEYLEAEFVSTLSSFGTEEKVIGELKEKLNDVEYLENTCRMQVRGQFERFDDVDGIKADKLLTEAMGQLDSIQRNIIVEKKFFRDQAQMQEMDDHIDGQLGGKAE